MEQIVKNISSVFVLPSIVSQSVEHITFYMTTSHQYHYIYHTPNKLMLKDHDILTTRNIYKLNELRTRVILSKLNAEALKLENIVFRH